MSSGSTRAEYEAVEILVMSPYVLESAALSYL